MSVPEKRSCIEPAHKRLSILRQCELIDLPRSSYYRPCCQGESAENLELMRLIDEEYMRHPFYGARKIRDWHSCFVLSWEVSVTMDDDFCVSALQSAMRRHGTPDIFNTDQGVQYMGKAFTSELKENGIKISMDSKGRWMDNVFIEKLWRSVKYEEVYLKEYASVKDLVQSLKIYFNFYNFERPHQSLDGKTLAETYFGTAVALKAA